jgi:hypothetical protein
MGRYLGVYGLVVVDWFEYEMVIESSTQLLKFEVEVR